MWFSLTYLNAFAMQGVVGKKWIVKQRPITTGLLNFAYSLTLSGENEEQLNLPRKVSLPHLWFAWVRFKWEKWDWSKARWEIGRVIKNCSHESHNWWCLQGWREVEELKRYLISWLGLWLIGWKRGKCLRFSLSK